MNWYFLAGMTQGACAMGLVWLLSWRRSWGREDAWKLLKRATPFTDGRSVLVICVVGLVVLIAR
jgi:hypothetical protein